MKPSKTPTRSALAIGNFDGVHRGHRALIDAVTEWRRAQPDASSIRCVAMTFDPHPAEVLRGQVIPRLTSMKERTHLLQSIGIDEVRVVHFTPEFAKMSARDFFNTLVVEDLHAAFVAIGHDFHFGHGREGTPGQFLDWCEKAQIQARLIEPVEADGAAISSTRIRKLIHDGQMVPASRLLGRDYSICGEVVHGDKRGRQIGFPTANLLPVTEGLGAVCLPARGVYLSSATVEGKTFASITNVGVKPTVSSSGQVVIETHLFDFTGDLYGKLLTVEFRDRLRDERKFSGLEELTQQIRKDIQQARHRLTGL